MERSRIETFADLSSEAAAFERAILDRRLRQIVEKEGTEKQSFTTLYKEVGDTEERKVAEFTDDDTTTIENTSSRSSLEVSGRSTLSTSSINVETNEEVTTLRLRHEDMSLEQGMYAIKEAAHEDAEVPPVISTVTPSIEVIKPKLMRQPSDDTPSPRLKRKYFGKRARDRFFEQYQWLSKQVGMMLPPSDGSSNSLHFENAKETSHRMLFHQDSEDYSSSGAIPPPPALSPLMHNPNLPSLSKRPASPPGPVALPPLHLTEEEAHHTRLLVNRARGSHIGGRFAPTATPDLSAPHTGLQSASSPRSTYILRCLTTKLNPRASLMVRKTMTKELHLSHYGMGNAMAVQLSESLKDLPLVNLIDISDNNLTDVGLVPMINAMSNMPALKVLNVSNNTFGPRAAAALSKYLANPGCTLTTLLLQHSDIDDFEGQNFIAALLKNKTLCYIDLSNNKLGHAEALNTVRPNTITATEALANILRSENCIVHTLKLSWNMIRLSSAVDLASSLRNNKSLTHLDLSYNTLGNEGGVALGDALFENRTIETLIINNNNLCASAVFVICVAITENLVLKKVDISNNPIGDAGARALMQLPLIVGNRVEIISNNCNLRILDESCWFKQDEMLGTYSLQLDRCYDRAVAFCVLQTVARHNTIVMSDIRYQAPASKRRNSIRTTKITVEQAMISDKEPYLTQAQRVVLENLEGLKRSAEDIKRATELFRAYDLDNSGEIDRYELKRLLDSLGFEIDNSKIGDLMAVFDIDGSNTIELPEFLSFVKSQYQEACGRIVDMTQTPVMVMANDHTKRYIPPRNGVLTFEVKESFLNKKNFQILTADEQKCIAKMARHAGDDDMTMLLSYAFQNAKIRLSEAFDLYTIMMKRMSDKTKVLAKLLPQIAFSYEARLLVSRVTHEDRNDMSKLKAAMGPALRPIFGLPNGYYALDLTKDTDRICLSRLLECSRTYNEARAAKSHFEPSRIGDTSQRGNWSAFRNERWNNTPITITVNMFSPMPKSGIIEFDFVGAERPHWSQSTLSDIKCTKVITNLAMVSVDKKDILLEELSEMKCMAEKSLYGDAVRFYEVNNDDSKIISECVTLFNDNLPSRWKYSQCTYANEEIKVNISGSHQGSMRTTMRVSSVSTNTLALSQDDIEIPDGMNAQEEVSEKRRKSLASVQSVKAIEETGLPMEMSAIEQNIAIRPRPTLFGTRIRAILQHDDVSEQAKACRIMETIEDILGGYWVRSRHVALLCRYFTIGKIDRVEHFGTYRVELVVTFFARIVDIHNIDLIWRELTPEEIACCFCRLGWLNLYNPMKPEGYWELNLSNWDERQVFKSLAVLSACEPGDNWLDVTFRWERHQPPIPGWTLTQPWLTVEGMGHRGILRFRYYCGDGVGNGGCRADILTRKSHLNLVLIEEWEVRSEDNHTTPGVAEKVGEKYMLDKPDRWLQYFYPAVSTSREAPDTDSVDDDASTKTDLSTSVSTKVKRRGSTKSVKKK